MYKVKEAADVLGVTRVEIFEIMVSQRELFEPYTSKTNSITYISEEGLALLKQMLKSTCVLTLDNDSEASEVTEENESDDLLESVENHDVPEELKLQELLSTIDSEEPSKDDLNDFDLSFTPSEDVSENKTAPFEDIESTDDLIGQWLKEIQSEDEEADQKDELLRQMRTQVTQMRNKILSLDSEIRRKDDAVRHYHEIMKDDVRWLEDLERKVQLIVKHGMLEKSEVVAEEDKSNRFKFFKK